MSIGGEHIQAGTGRRFTYWATFAQKRGSPAQIIYIAQIRESGRCVDSIESDLLFDACRYGADEALRFRLKSYIDRARFRDAFVGPDMPATLPVRQVGAFKRQFG